MRSTWSDGIFFLHRDSVQKCNKPNYSSIIENKPSQLNQDQMLHELRSSKSTAFFFKAKKRAVKHSPSAFTKMLKNIIQRGRGGRIGLPLALD